MIAALAPVALAQEAAVPSRWYEVEVIVFERTNVAADDPERFDRSSGLPAVKEATELLLESVNSETPLVSALSAVPPPVPYLLLTNIEHKLAPEYASLARARNYTPLLHAAWRQPVVDEQDAPAVYLNSRVLSDWKKKASAPLMLGESQDEPAVEQLDYTNLQPEVDGFVRLSVGRFLHVAVDMEYLLPEPYWTHRDELPRLPEGAGDSAANQATVAMEPNSLMVADTGPPAPMQHPIRRYRLEESRRVRRNEVHYFDHPRFGVLVQVRAYDWPPQ